jgi:ribosomal protein L29
VPDHTPGYVAGLATQLRTRHPDLLQLAEDELSLLRGRMQTIARFLHNPAIALDIRQNLAQDLHLPTPEN